MEEHSYSYIKKCIKLGILTNESPRKYPLRNANLAMVLKLYATSSRQPYTITNAYEVLDHYTYYLTEGGFDWLLYTFNKHSLEFLRSNFSVIFTAAKKEDVLDPQYQGYANFRGDKGDRPKAGTKQKAILIHQRGHVKKEYKFDTLKEARETVLDLSRFYPIDQFELYRIRKYNRKGSISYGRSKVDILLPTSKRGVNSNLPHLRK